ncbi:SusC/RagA family TonB-linked outer membrane protein [Chitinophaga sp. SYP-B3965]|uniref:SusC/RagA family TonB-linked outer membrane protein n=1 Tax=Chitinophaga sp. SYP-B3965 TaxID=2663120 RepID=UPI001299AD43|nr:TonB-dependent receptor [Chitinophaga sp. SYP-B3965]MRG43888.1 SusC/RagA family TonB-linked outer membrane protein [Chitinophaga sp. SYP-B3965]
MKKIYYLLMLLSIFPLCALAQQKTISGKVTDAKDGTALPGVSVFTTDAAGKRTGVTTNTRGEYSLNVPAAINEVFFVYLGMNTVTERIDGRTTINVTLTASDAQLEQVVVVGYGTRRKETLTGAVSNITAKDIQTTTNISLAQKLQGKVAGLQIRQLGGEPGTFDNMINIRGFGTPLFVIDGIARDGGSEFQRLNPDDIESVSFLKDASAAIYGLRAANGVVIVTTKKGAAGKASFNYTGVVGFMRPTDVPKMANAAQFMQMRNDADIFKLNGAPSVTKDELQKWIDGVPGYESTDWYDVTMKDHATQQQHNLSASGGSEKTQYFMSLAYADEGSLLRSNDMNYKRFNLRSNVTTELHKNLKAELFVAGRYDKKVVPGENFFNIFKGTRVTLPTEKPYANNNPEYPAVVTPSNQNPLTLSNKDITGYGQQVTRNVQSTLALTYTVPFVEGLSLRATGAYDMTSYQAKDVSRPYKLFTYVNNEYVVSPQRGGTAAITNNYGNYNQLTLQAQANYIRSFGKHNVTGLLVFEQMQNWSRDAYLKRLYEFYTGDQIGNASTTGQENNGGEGQSANLSYVGRFSYDYNRKYLIDFAFRQDGSYRYHPSKRWSFFPVVTGGWRISEEAFMKEKLPVVSNLKIRASYGLVGNDAGNPFQYIAGFSTGGGGRYEFENGSLTNGAASPAIVNEQLQWNTSTVTDIGIDLGLFRGKLNIEFDVYRRDREGLLEYRNVSLPNTFGGTLPQENLNSDRVQGLEFTITHNNKIGDFSYNISGNFNYSRTMMLYVERGPWANSYSRWKSGRENRYNDVLWGYTYLGQFQSMEEISKYPMQNGEAANIRELPGDFKYKDVNNDGVIDGNDELPLWIGANGNNNDLNPQGKNPKINYGLSLSGSWKGLDVNLLFQGSAMYTVRFSEVYAEVLAFRGNTPAYFFDRWHKADPYDPNSAWVAGKWPASRFNGDVGGMYKESSVWRKDASYVRLKSVELGYTISPRIYKAAGIQRIRIFANGFNLFTWADSFVKAFDPERLEGLFNAGFNYPLTKNYNVGVNLNF